MKAIGIREFGGPDRLETLEVERPEPAAGEVLVRLACAGVNYIDVYMLSLIHISEPTRPY